MHRFIIGFLGSLLMGLSSAIAAPVQWTLKNVLFDDGGTASGTFVYDATLNVYSNFNITTTAGGSFGGATYTNYLNSPFGPTLNFITAAGTSSDLGIGGTWIGLSFSSGLSNAGGVVSLAGGQESICTTNPPPGFFCGGAGNATLLRSVVSGAVSAVVPVPAAVWLFGGALGALGMMKRRTHPTA
ncbi:MAG: VPLPA-CTERM sorting domain-containing protein [Gammaproteobacteria bacterium]|nr:VPLPA-CTERM sorting domain-containing protein [Gammaproteobacteria bacterium]